MVDDYFCFLKVDLFLIDDIRFYVMYYKVDICVVDDLCGIVCFFCQFYEDF